jgi:hypothetical protein
VMINKDAERHWGQGEETGRQCFPACVHVQPGMTG